MLTYRVYGLSIRSELSLPELVTSEGRADVLIRFGRRSRRTKRLHAGGYSFRKGGDEVCLAWEQVGRFRIRAGCEVTIEPDAGIEEDVLRTLLLGPALGVLLHQRGALILHGSAIALLGAVVGFLGQTGAGKSTAAATLHARGHPVVADDVIAIQDNAGSPLVLAGYPQLNLWPDSAASVGHDLATLPQLHSRIQKYRARAIEGFSCDSLPLRLLYTLSHGTRNQIEDLCPQEALMALLRHSYGARLVRGRAARDHFVYCANLVRTTRIRRLAVRPALAELPNLAALVEEDALQNAA